VGYVIEGRLDLCFAFVFKSVGHLLYFYTVYLMTPSPTRIPNIEISTTRILKSPPIFTHNSQTLASRRFNFGSPPTAHSRKASPLSLHVVEVCVKSPLPLSKVPRLPMPKVW
jgi:hypothetical protein